MPITRALPYPARAGGRSVTGKCLLLMATRSPKRVDRRTEARLVRLTPAELAGWKTAAAASGRTLSEFARQAIEAEARRQAEARGLEEQRRAEGLPGVMARLDGILEQARRLLRVLADRLQGGRDPA